VAGKRLSVNIDMNSTKFFGSAFAIRPIQKCRYLSEEILCKIVLTN
jgi:hypothetical protein